MSQTVNLKFDFNQLLSMVKQCDAKQKMVIVEALQKDTFKIRFKKLLAELKDNDISPEEVTKEVELIRKKRYEAKKQ